MTTFRWKIGRCFWISEVFWSEKVIISKLMIQWTATKLSGIDWLYLPINNLHSSWFYECKWTGWWPVRKKSWWEWSTNSCRFCRTIGLLEYERRWKSTIFLRPSLRIVPSNFTRKRDSDPSKIHSGISDRTVCAVRPFHCPGNFQRSFSQLRTAQKTTQLQHWKSETWSVGSACGIANKVFIQGVPK